MTLIAHFEAGSILIAESNDDGYQADVCSIAISADLVADGGAEYAADTALAAAGYRRASEWDHATGRMVAEVQAV